MRPGFHRGLVVGKFSPLHQGHDLAIQRALAECAEVILISYSNPEFPGCGAAERARWLEALYPQTRRLVVTDELLAQWKPRVPDLPETIPPNDAPDLIHRRFCGMLCHEVLGVTVDAVFTSEAYGDGFAQELTRFFRVRQPDAASVHHILVDRQRTTLPISGTQIRVDIHHHRAWLPPPVYASFVKRVCLLGGESTGKSTLALELAREFQTISVAEFGRELWETQGGRLDFDDLLRIAQVQIAREESALLHANEFLFCDTSPLTTLFYSGHMFGRAAPELVTLAQRSYHTTLLCAADFPFVQDGTRQPETFRDHQQQWYRAELQHRSIPCIELTGAPAHRIAQARQYLKA